MPTGKDSENCPATAQPQRVTGVSRTTVAFWKDRVEKVKGRNGKESPNYSARISYQEKRVRFPLNTPNKDAAASMAAKIFRFLIANGWETTIKEFKPHVIARRDRACTVGDLIRVSLSLCSAREETKESYAKSMRRIVAGVFGINDQSKYDSLTGGAAEWRKRVDRVRLDKITPTKVLAWKNRYIAEAATNPLRRRSAKVTANTLIRSARCLFGKRILPSLKTELNLPSPLPFKDIVLDKLPPTRYRSKIDAVSILKAAKTELAEAAPEQFKILILSLLCGLRRGEIDHLLWDAFDFENKLLHIRHTEYHELKSDDSEGELDLDDDVLAIFRGYLAKSEGDFVIHSEYPPSTERNSRSYRCDIHFNRLIEWLRGKGVTANKPIHELRKEIGSLINEEHGLFEASRYLRHSDIRITSAYYVDKLSCVTPSLGKLLSADDKTVEFSDAEPQNPSERIRGKALA